MATSDSRTNRANQSLTPGSIDEKFAIRTKRPAELAEAKAIDKTSDWSICLTLASRQKGIVTLAQLLGADIHASRVKRWAAKGLLHRLHHGVYAVGHLALAPLALEQAALLACGDRGLISHTSALGLWGIVSAPPSEVHVMVVGHDCRRKAGIRVHRVKDIDDRDVRRRNGLPVTSPARSLIDVAASASLTELDDVIAEARARRLIRDGELERVLERCERTRGAPRMRAFLKAEMSPGLTRSKAERVMRRLMRAANLPEPVPNQRVAGWEVDFLWDAEKLVVEVDGPQFHGHRRAYERDRRKDLELTTAGYVVIRITPRQLDEEPFVVVAHVARMLDRRAQDLGRSRRPPPH